MRDIDLNRLQIFKVVVLAGSFSRAATQLRMPKSRVSRQIAALEAEMGTALIYRTTRAFQLTEAGKTLFQRAVPLLGDLESVLQNVGGSPTLARGLVRMTVPEDIAVELMAGMVHEFQLAYPDVHVDLVVENRVVDLVKEGVDLALRIGQGRDSTLTTRRLGEIPLQLFAAPSLYGRAVRPAKVEDLARLPYLSFFGHGEQTLKLRGPKSRVQLKLVPHMSCNNFFVLKKMTLLGNGFALLPGYLVAREVAAGELVPLFPEWGSEPAPVALVYPPQKNMPPRLRALIDFMATRGKARIVLS